MRALILHSGNLFGGIETALISLAQGCRSGRAPLEPVFALCFDQGRVGRELRAAGATVHALGATRLSQPWQVLRARARLRRLLATEPFDVCVMPSTWTHALFAPVVRRRGLPLAVWAHDRWTPERWLDRLALRHRPDLIVANSEFTRAGMKSAMPDVPVSLVHYPLVLPPIVRDGRAQVRAAFNAPDDSVVIVQVGRLDPYKGHGILLEALGGLSTSASWRCWIVGGADTPVQRDYLARLQQTARALGIADRVTFAGAREDVNAVLAAADLFCHPNIEPEPFGIVFIEALRAGLAVVGTASGGVLDIVTDACGRLVAPGDGGALGAVLTELILSSDLRATLGAHGPARALELCEVDARVRDFSRALAGLVIHAPLSSRAAAPPSAFVDVAR